MAAARPAPISPAHPTAAKAGRNIFCAAATPSMWSIRWRAGAPATRLPHSQSGAMGWPIADKRPNLVKGIVAVEPRGPPAHDVDFKGAPDWFSDAAKTKISGLGDVPLTYDPPLKDDTALAFVRQDKADKPDLVRCW